jgi:hypothetical protein
MRKVFLLEDLCDESHVLADSELISVGCGYACAFLPSMLECIKTEESQPGDVFVWREHPENAASLSEALQTAPPSSLDALPDSGILARADPAGQTGTLTPARRSLESP